MSNTYTVQYCCTCSAGQLSTNGDVAMVLTKLMLLASAVASYHTTHAHLTPRTSGWVGGVSERVRLGVSHRIRKSGSVHMCWSCLSGAKGKSRGTHTLPSGSASWRRKYLRVKSSPAMCMCGVEHTASVHPPSEGGRAGAAQGASPESRES